MIKLTNHVWEPYTSQAAADPTLEELEEVETLLKDLLDEKREAETAEDIDFWKPLDKESDLETRQFSDLKIVPLKVTADQEVLINLCF